MKQCIAMVKGEMGSAALARDALTKFSAPGPLARCCGCTFIASADRYVKTLCSCRHSTNALISLATFRRFTFASPWYLPSGTGLSRLCIHGLHTSGKGRFDVPASSTMDSSKKVGKNTGMELGRLSLRYLPI